MLHTIIQRKNMRHNFQYQIEQWLVLFNKAYPVIPMRYQTNITTVVELDATHATAKDLNEKIFQLLREIKSTFITQHSQLLDLYLKLTQCTEPDTIKKYLNNMIEHLGKPFQDSATAPSVMHTKLIALNSLDLDPGSIVDQDALAVREAEIDNTDIFISNYDDRDRLTADIHKVKHHMEQELENMNSQHFRCSIS